MDISIDNDKCMESKQKLAWLIILPLVIGVAIGFSFGKNTGSQKAIEVTNSNKDETVPTSDVKPDASKKALALRKLDLLKYYTNFVLLPKEKFADPKKYGEDMSAVVTEINDDEITSRYNATVEADNDEQRVVNIRVLLNYLSDSIRSDLQ